MLVLSYIFVKRYLKNIAYYFCFQKRNLHLLVHPILLLDYNPSLVIMPTRSIQKQQIVYHCPTVFKDKFLYSFFIKIFRNLIYDYFKEIKDQIKANSIIIYSDLGGGTNSHAGFILNFATFAIVSAKPILHHVGGYWTYWLQLQKAVNRLWAEHKEQLDLL